MENYFILLGLKYDPPENDEAVIKDAIEKKRQQWQNEAKNPRKQIQAKENISKIPTIEDVMLNPQKRAEEAQKATKMMDSYIRNLKNEILLLSVKGNIEEEEFKQLADKYKAFSIDEDKIKSLITVPIGEAKEISVDKIKSIPEDVASQLEMYFSNLDIDDMSIYKFYGISENAAPAEVENKAQQRLKAILDKGTKDNRDEIEQKIAGLIIGIFNSDPISYRNYLLGCRYSKINKLIKTGVSKNKIMTFKTYQTLVEIIKTSYSFSKKQIKDYIIANCNINGYEVSQEVLSDPAVELQPVKREIKIKVNTPPAPPPPSPQETKTQLINKMTGPIHNLLINNTNNIDKMTNYLKSYKKQREEKGSAISSVVGFGVLGLFGGLSIFDIVLIIINLGTISPIGLFGFIGGIIANIVVMLMHWGPFSKWRKMSDCVYQASKNSEAQKKLYNDFVSLNFNLLTEDGNAIISNLKSMQERSNNLFNNTKDLYEKYTTISKTYYQNEYFSRVLLLAIILHVGLIAYTIFLL